jgi:ketosteroid isomerase-like protein
MSEENVEAVLECFRRFEAGDIDGFTALFDPKCRATGPEGWPEPGPAVGRDEVVEQFVRITSELEEGHFSLDVVSAEGEWVVVDVRYTGRGAGSGLDVAFNVTNAVRVREGRVLETHYGWTREEALEVAGLSE